MEIKVLRKFIDEADRLILRHITKERIKSTRIRQLENHREALTIPGDPMSTLALRYLDEMIDFAHILNAEGVEAAEPKAQIVIATLNEIADQVQAIGDIAEHVEKVKANGV